MKTTIISIILIITCISFLNSCREHELENMEELQMKKESKMPTKMFMKSENDSLNITSSLEIVENKGEGDDPPPKDRGQWKLVQ